MFLDTSGTIGFGAICNASWTFGEWEPEFLAREPSIEFQELYGVTVGILNWIHRFKDRRVCLFCDSISVVFMINNMMSKCKHCMVLIRMVVLECLKLNVKLSAKYINTKKNGLADSLSRLDFQRFWHLAEGKMDENPTPILTKLWPVSKVWFH